MPSGVYPRPPTTKVECVCEGCGAKSLVRRDHVAKGWKRLCSACRQRVSLFDRLETKRIRRAVGCWGWTGALNTSGRGVLNRGKTGEGTVQAHVAAFAQAAGYWPAKDQVVGHTCDVPTCTRNDGEPGTYEIEGRGVFPRYGHLWIGTQPDNVADMDQKGRRIPPALLTKDEVREIRAKLATGKYGILVQLAAEYDISPRTIADIRDGKTWKGV